MHKPETHLDVVRDRHSDLLREARAGELAARLAASRRAERRALVGRLRGLRESAAPARTAAST